MNFHLIHSNENPVWRKTTRKLHGAMDVAVTFSRRMKTIDTIRLSPSDRQDIRIVLRSLIIVRVCI